MYNAEEEKRKILAMLDNVSKENLKYTKQENFFRAIEFALDEVNELEAEFQRFIHNVNHLEVFQEMVKQPMEDDMQKMVQNLRYLIEKNYTKKDKESMPFEVLQQVQATQEKRMKLLQNVAKRYFHRNHH